MHKYIICADLVKSNNNNLLRQIKNLKHSNYTNIIFIKYIYIYMYILIAEIYSYI